MKILSDINHTLINIEQSDIGHPNEEKRNNTHMKDIQSSLPYNDDTTTPNDLLS